MGRLLKPEEHPLISEEEELRIRAGKGGFEDLPLSADFKPIYDISEGKDPLLEKILLGTGNPTGTDQPILQDLPQGTEQDIDVYGELTRDKNVNIYSKLEGEDGYSSRYKTYMRADDLVALKLAIDPTLDRALAKKQAVAELSATDNVRGLFDAYQSQYTQKKIDEESELVNKTIHSTTEDMDNFVNEAIEQLAAIHKKQEKFEGELGEATIFISENAAKGLAQEVKDDLIARNYMNKTIVDYYDGKNKFDVALDIPGLIFKPDFILNTHDLVKTDWDVTTGLFSSIGGLRKVIQEFQSLPPSERPAAWDVLFPQIVDAYDDNVFKVLIAASFFNSATPISDVDLETGMALIDMVAVGIDSAVMMATATRMVNKLRKAGNTRRAGREVARRYGDLAGEGMEETPSSPNGEHLDDAQSVHPLDASETVIGGGTPVDGVSGEINRIYNNLVEALDADVTQPLDEIVSSGLVIPVRPLAVGEESRIVDEVMEARRAEALRDGHVIESIRPAKLTKEGFTFEYDLNDMDGNPLRTVTTTRLWTEDDVGNYTAINPNYDASSQKKGLLHFFQTPEGMMRYVDDTLVNKLTFGDMQADRVRNTLTAFAKTLDDGMTKKEILNVNELLMAGDELEEVFSGAELISPTIEVASGRRAYTEKEIINYYKKRAFSDRLWEFHNQVTRHHLSYLGAKQFTYNDVNGGEEFGKKLFVIPKERPLQMEFKDTDLILAPQVAGNSNQYISGAQFKKRWSKLKDDGYQAGAIVDKYAVDGNPIKVVLFKDEGVEGVASLQDLPQDVLHYREGQVTREYVPGYVFIKDQATGSTMAIARSKKEGDAWVKEYRENAPLEIERVKADPDLSEEEKATRIRLLSMHPEAFRDRDIDSLSSFVESTSLFGGLVTGSRKSTPLVTTNGEEVNYRGSLVDIYGNKLERHGWAESTQRSISSVARGMPLNTFRQATATRFSNNINDLVKASNPNKTFPEPGKTWIDSDIPLADPTLRASLENQRQYLISQLTIPTREETFYARSTAALADWVIDGPLDEGKWLGEKLRGVALNLNSKDPITVLKSATFISQLGMLNPRHLYVQSINAALAVSIEPKLAPKALGKSLAMRTLLYVPENMLKKVTGNAATAAGEDSGELYQSIVDFRKSGLLDSITTNPDMTSLTQGLAPSIPNTLKNVSNKSLFFFRAGESYSRLVAWNIARDKLGIKGAATDEQIGELVKETFRLNMNMQKANSAKFQTNGYTALGGQYQQVITKFVEKLFGDMKGGGGEKSGRWTSDERFRVGLGQVLLFGTGGIYGAGEIVNYIADTFDTTSAELEASNPMIHEMVTDGIVGTMAQLMGMENTFGGETASLWSATTNNQATIIVKGLMAMVTGEYENHKESLPETFFGAPGTMINKTWDAVYSPLEGLMKMIALPTFETALTAVGESIDTVASITSTWSNARKILFLERLGGYRSKHGKLLMSTEEVRMQSTMTQLAAAMGIQMDVLTATRRVEKEITDRQRTRTDTVKAIAKAYRNGITTGDTALAGAMIRMFVSEYDDNMVREDLKHKGIEMALREESSASKVVGRSTAEYLAGGGESVPAGTFEVLQALDKEAKRKEQSPTGEDDNKMIPLNTDRGFNK